MNVLLSFSLIILLWCPLLAKRFMNLYTVTTKWLIVILRQTIESKFRIQKIQWYPDLEIWELLNFSGPCNLTYPYQRN